MRLTLPLPPSANRLTRTILRHGRAVAISSSEYRAWKAAATDLLELCRLEALDGPVSVTMGIYYKDNRRDIDSAVKPALDILQGYCYGNDRQVERLEVTKLFDKANPRVEITVGGV